MSRSDASSLRCKLGQVAGGTARRSSQAELWKEVVPLDRGAIHEWLGVLRAGGGPIPAEPEGRSGPQAAAGPRTGSPQMGWPGTGEFAGSMTPPMDARTPGSMKLDGSVGRRAEPTSAPALARASETVTSPVRTRARHRPSAWAPPLAVLIDVARSAAHTACGAAVWIGDRVCPYGRALAEPAPIACPRDAGRAHSLNDAGRAQSLRDAQQAHQSRDLLARSVFVRATSAADRLWSCEVALRSGAACAVIADGSGFDLAATRRLQLAAEAGGTPCLLARPDRELSVRSAAMTRWVVRWAASEHAARRWSVELVRCKGLRRASELGRPLILEQDHATGVVRLVADILHGSGHAAARDDAARRTG